MLRVRRRHPRRPWPLRRTIPFLLGLLVINLATQSGIGTYDDTLFWDHMIQHLMLIMIAPPLLVAGQPVTLLLHASRNPLHTGVKKLIRSRPVQWLTLPAFGVAAYAATIVGTHLTSFMNLVTEHDAVHEAEHVLYLVVGYLYFLPLIGKEPIRWKVSYPLRLFLLFIAMPVDAFTGVVLGSYQTDPFVPMEPRSWGPSAVNDLHRGRRGDVDRRRRHHVRGDHGDVLPVDQGEPPVGGHGLAGDGPQVVDGRPVRRGQASRAAASSGAAAGPAVHPGGRRRRGRGPARGVQRLSRADQPRAVGPSRAGAVRGADVRVKRPCRRTLDCDPDHS